MSQPASSLNSFSVPTKAHIDPGYQAVYAKNLVKCFDRGPPTLQNVNMTVKKGTIYGLLGPSGCGKTTILSCIVGLQTWDDGELLELGHRPGKQLATKLGYMPQEVSLYDQLTVFEIVKFYGKLYKLSEKEIHERWNILFTLLEFPKEFRPVRDLSGGQRRRASLALALIHNRELLILDEPTVGLDPVLREKIWNHLTQITKLEGTTKIITTHYMEEARFCDTIGIMRKGQIIAEETPTQLLRRYNCDILEEAVLGLCRDHEKSIKAKPFKNVVERNVSSNIKIARSTNANVRFNNNIEEYNNTPADHVGECVNDDHKFGEIYHRLQKIQGLTTVITLTLLRHRGFLAMLLFMPAIHCWLSLSVIGSREKDLHFGVVNNDLTNWQTECKNQSYIENPCSHMSVCGFLNLLQQDNLLILEDFKTEEVALKQVQLGQTWGYISIPANQSTHLIDFAMQKFFSSNETLEGSRIKLRVDHSQYITAFFLVRNLYNYYLKYTTQLAQICGMSKTFELPMNYRPAIYGNYTDNFADFVLPGVLLMSIGILSVVLSALLFASDYQQKTLSRAHVAGLRITDIICSHMIVQSVIGFVQTGLLTGILYFAFDFRIHGYESQLLYFMICILLGPVATLLGLFQGILCKNEVITLTFGIFMTPIYILFGGVYLSTETTTWFWQQMGYVIPLKVPIAALRSVLTRELGITHPLVWTVFVASSIWILALVTGIIIMFRSLKL